MNENIRRGCWKEFFFEEDYENAKPADLIDLIAEQFDLDDEALFGPSDNLLEEADIDEQDLDIYGLVIFNFLSNT